jgi:hypothetical protein
LPTLIFTFVFLIILVRNPLTGREHLGDLGIVGKIILKLILKKCVVRIWTGFSCLMLELNDGLL